MQSSFGPEERLTNNRELTIRPKEDSCVQLMFSPTRIGCMLAKLEIKQSGIKSSQPGIKFTVSFGLFWEERGTQFFSNKNGLVLKPFISSLRYLLLVMVGQVM